MSKKNKKTFSITGVFTTLKITKHEYTQLVRDSETLNLLRNYLSSGKFISTEDIRILLNIEKREPKGSEE